MTNRQQITAQLPTLDFRLLLIAALITVSTGHVGRLFADREDARQAFIGYVLAVAVDGVLALSLADLARFRERTHKRFSMSVFVLTCVVSAGFNTAYYRQNYPLDPWALSLGLGAVAPILAAFVAVAREFAKNEQGDAEQVERDSDRSLELEKYKVEQAELTLRAVEKERTKQENARARAAKATVQTSDKVAVKSNGHKRSFTDFERAILSGELSLDMSGAAVGEWAGKGSATGRRWKREVQSRNGSGVEVVEIR